VIEDWTIDLKFKLDLNQSIFDLNSPVLFNLPRSLNKLEPVSSTQATILNEPLKIGGSEGI
jgi:hypothetical protein